ncbi:NAD-dependent epimerase/dehydratase family protein [Natronosporangium hydrolyticum]|uniref:NAD-dependent epimerase/dehydratase family protein n=1 Tax=Natronosporangium hydrolyticum TaxID=2811111 RepID=A0A895YIT0_9ACTN|nr:NAD-dependent epimerase/dehydratase family protein [Natronosporangium hydrolyticum]QSB14496.1 NAD-dependent epimerase/dehydratase family protein [Natronosporangium hydrolyticum]
MRLLILGGTVFLGRAVARHAVAAGHDVTCLARGVSGTPVAGVRFLSCDRGHSAAYSLVDGERFDAVIDVTSDPRHARGAVAALGDRIDHWVYVSSISVYADHSQPHQRAETTPLQPPADPAGDDPRTDPETYGRAKVACEAAVRDGVGAARSLIARAGLIVGPADPTGRFTYWVTRLARGGRVLAPNEPTDLVQVVDVRDLAAWLVLAAEQRLSGTFDTVSEPVPFAELLAEVALGVAAEPSLVWVPEVFLRDHDVRFWSGERSLPLWLPRADHGGMVSRDTSAALAAGLRIRPFAETASATLEWVRAGGDADARPAGLTEAAEMKLLRAWDAAAAEPAGSGT